MSTHRIKVSLYFRRPRPGNYSIERLFETITSAMPDSVDIEMRVCPHLSNGFLRRASNILFAYRTVSKVNHITGDVLYLALGLPKKRVILTFHDAAMLNVLKGLRKYFYKLFWFDMPMKKASKITCVSYTTRENLVKHFPYLSNSIHVIPNCVKEDFKYVPKAFHEARPRILLIGTKENKNMARVISALVGIDCELRIVGRLTETQRDILERANLDYSNVWDLSPDFLVSEYVECDLLCFASIFEGFGMPIVEAQVTGRVVLTSNCSSMPEVAGEGACLVDPFDPISIRAGVLKIINNPDYRLSLIEMGRRNAERFSVSEIANQYACLYHDVARSAQ